VHIRGWKSSEKVWKTIIDKIHLQLSVLMKSPADPFVKAETKLLRRLQESPADVSEFSDIFQNLPINRMLHEIAFYERFIYQQDSKWQISEHGKEWINLYSITPERN